MKYLCAILFSACFLIGLPTAQAAPQIDTVAGGGLPNNLPGTSTALQYPDEVAVDSAGNIFIAVHWRHIVTKLDVATGMITTVAGTGVKGFSGDEGLASLAKLNKPRGVAVDIAGNLFIADYDNHNIRRVDATTGVITTIAGTGVPGFSGDGRLATEAMVDSPHGIALDQMGNLFIADSYNNRIRRVDSTTGFISTVAGSGYSEFFGDGALAIEAALANPAGVAVDNVGNLFISDTDNHRIRRVDGTTGLISTVAGKGFQEDPGNGDGGPATAALIFVPRRVAVDDSGNLFIADGDQNRIRLVDGVTGIITTVAGTGSFGSGGDGGLATNAGFHYPHGVAVDQIGNFYIADSGNHRIRRVDFITKAVTTVAGNGTQRFFGDGEEATKASLFRPSNVAIDQEGNFFIADALNHVIRKVDVETGQMSTVAGIGGNGGSFRNGVLATTTQLFWPRDVAMSNTGDLYIADSWHNRIQRVDAATGIITTVAGTGSQAFSGDGGLAVDAELARPLAIALDAVGNLFIADYLNYRIRRVDAVTGIITTVAGTDSSGLSEDGVPATSAKLALPIGVAVDNSGNLFITQTYYHSIRRVDAITGLISTVVGTGTAGFSGDGGLASAAELNGPQGLFVDNAEHLFIADLYNHAIRRVDATTGIITTVVGVGSFGFSGDGGLATEAELALPYGVTVDSLGRIFFADSSNDRIRRVDAPNGAPTVNAGTDGSISAGSAFGGAGSFTDTDSTSWGSTVDWGDGSSIEPLSLTGMTFTLNHLYPNPGLFTVTVMVTDDGGEPGVDTLTITVTDSTPPVVTAPSNIIVTPVDGAGTPDTDAVIQAFLAGATAVDAVDGSIVPTHNAPSQFPLGTTTVTFQGTDLSGNVGEATATVTVTGPVVLEASQDSFLYSNPKNANEGGNTFMRLTKKFNNRAVVAFGQLATMDLLGLTKATLVLTVQESTGWKSGEVVNVHRLLVPWAEGNGAHVNTVSSESTVPGVTWNCATDVNLHNSQPDCAQQWSGGTFAGVAALGVIHSNALSGSVDWEVTQDVQVGATLGWVIKKQRETKAGTASYYTKEGAVAQANASLAPKLILEFANPN